MVIKEIKGNEFAEFASNHMLKNLYQTKEYGDLMSHSEFNVMYIGAFQKGTLIAASLILYKAIGMNMKYGYAPRGFLVDYFDKNTLELFTKKVKEFFFRRGFAFIKINPEISYATIDFKDRSKAINPKTRELITTLKELGYDKLKDNLYFESMLPKYTPVIYLPTYDLTKIELNTYNAIKRNELIGFKLVQGTEEDLPKFYEFVKDKDTKTATYYKFLYNTYKESEKADLLFVELTYDNYVKYLQKEYIYEQERNEKINREFNENPNNEDVYNRKTKSDQTMAKISADIVTANAKMEENKLKEILGGALVIKHEGRVTIIISGNIQDFQGVDAKTFMFYKIIEEYKKAGYLYVDLYGITADFSETNPYKNLNNFKLKFNPTVYEYIGEFDLIINKPFHQLLWSTNQIQKEFYKPSIKR
jgi:lipid II:glycine glycyltransferase (peptidoglycan interpeptide bridge formation enzyme)